MSDTPKPRAAVIAATGISTGHKIEALYEPARLRLRQWQSGPRSASLDGGGSGLERCTEASCPECPMPESRYDDDREHFHPRAAGDPTGNAAFTGGRIDAKLANLEADVAIYDRVSLRISRTLAEVFPTGDPKQAPDPTDWCTHHLATLAECVPRHRGDRCRACYDFERVNHTLPPKEILDAWHDGRRVSQHMVDGALAKPRRKKAG